MQSDNFMGRINKLHRGDILADDWESIHFLSRPEHKKIFGLSFNVCSRVN